MGAEGAPPSTGGVVQGKVFFLSPPGLPVVGPRFDLVVRVVAHMTSVIAVNVFDIFLDAFCGVNQIGIGIRVASANTFLRSFGVTVIGIPF